MVKSDTCDVCNKHVLITEDNEYVRQNKRVYALVMGLLDVWDIDLIIRAKEIQYENSLSERLNTFTV